MYINASCEYVQIFTVVYVSKMYIKKIGKLCIYACLVYLGKTDKTNAQELYKIKR